MRYKFTAKLFVTPSGGRVVALELERPEGNTMVFDLPPREAIKVAAELLTAAREAMPVEGQDQDQEESEIEQARRAISRMFR